MSWDAIIMQLGDVKSIGDFPADYKPPPVADSSTLQDVLRRLFPDADHQDELTNVIGDDYWLELIHGCHPDDLGNVSALSVRSNAGRGATPQLKAICEALNARLFDIQTSELVDFSDDIHDSMQSFAEWRDRELAQNHKQT